MKLLKPRALIALLLCPLIGGWNGSFFHQQNLLKVYVSDSIAGSWPSSPYSLNFNNTGCPNSLLVVAASVLANTTITAMQYNGTALTSASAYANSTIGYTAVYYLKNPPVGNYPIDLTISTGKSVMVATVLCNVDQTTPIGIVATNINTSVSLGLTATAAVRGMTFGYAAQFQTGTPLTNGASQTEIGPSGITSSTGGAALNLTASAAYLEGTGNSGTFSWTGSTSTTWRTIGLPINPVSF